MIAYLDLMPVDGHVRRCALFMQKFAKESLNSGKGKGHRMPESVLALYFLDGGALNEPYLARHDQVRTRKGIQHLREYLRHEQTHSVSFARRLPQFTR